jgi:hypothetical protein
MNHQRFFWLVVSLGATAACTSVPDSRFADADISAINGSNGADTGPSFGPIGDGGSSGPCVASSKNYDIPGNGCDDDGDGQTDNAASCDTALATAGSANDFAKALGLCRDASDGGWGVISAEYRGGYSGAGKLNDQQHGILSKFGDMLVPREGSKLGVISSGFAREFNAASGTGACFVSLGNMGNPKSSVLAGYPKAVKGCTSSNVVNDVIVVRLKVRVPANAKGLSFDFNFFTSEWPAFVCSNYNDAFLAVLKSAAFNSGKPENISFDPNHNPVSVNNDFFDRCTPKVATGCWGDRQGTSSCAGGEGELKGTGYYCKEKYCAPESKDVSTGGGATGWLQTKAPVQPGEEIQLDFMIWDTGDSALNSSTLIDNFRWEASETTTVTDRPR